MENILLPQKNKILKITPQTDIEWLFKVESPIEVKCGQFLQVSIPKVGEVPISVANYDRKEQWIEFLIRKVGKVTNAVFELKEGDFFFIRGAYGTTFPLNELEGKPIVIVSGGSGLAPVRPLIKKMIREQPELTTLIMGFKEPNAILFKDDIKEWESSKAQIFLTVDQNPSPGMNEGLVTKYVADVLKNKDLSKINIVIVGPPMMMHFAAKTFLEQKVKENQIWVSYERNMSCAVGKCGHCKIGDTYICLEGPVFNFTKAKLLID
ncbi:MAG: anaerobic sulfite reductase subunit AsrB [Treponemataceae bacterium]